MHLLFHMQECLPLHYPMCHFLLNLRKFSRTRVLSPLSDRRRVSLPPSPPPPPSQPGLETGGLGRGGDQLTKNEADEKINPVARNETEGRGEDDGDFRTAAGGGGGGEMERKQERME